MQTCKLDAVNNKAKSRKPEERKIFLAGINMIMLSLDVCRVSLSVAIFLNLTKNFGNNA